MSLNKSQSKINTISALYLPSAWFHLTRGKQMAIPISPYMVQWARWADLVLGSSQYSLMQPLVTQELQRQQSLSLEMTGFYRSLISIKWFGTICAIWKTWKAPTEERYFSILKATLHHGCFSRFLNCTNGIKSRKASRLQFWFTPSLFLKMENL